MEATEIIAKSLEMDRGVVKLALDGLSDDDLTKRPSDRDNPAGWLIWHQFRVEDSIIAHVTGGAQVWAEGSWHEKFGLEADPQDMGVGHTLERVMALQVTKEDLKGYTRAVRERTLAALENLSAADLDREVPDYGGDPIRVGELLGRMTIDHFHHSGQVCYLRGHLTGWGWFPM